MKDFETIYCDLWTLNCVISQLWHLQDADDCYYNKSVWTILKVAFLVFVPAVAANEFAKNTILYWSLIDLIVIL